MQVVTIVVENIFDSMVYTHRWWRTFLMKRLFHQNGAKHFQANTLCTVVVRNFL